MQDEITDRQLDLAAAAFALVFGFYALYAWRRPIGLLFGLANKAWLFWPDPVHCSFWVVSVCVGTTLAILVWLAKEGRLAHLPEFFLAWEGVSLLAAEFFPVTRNSPINLNQTDTPQVTVKVYPLYGRLVLWLPLLARFRALIIAIHITHIARKKLLRILPKEPHCTRFLAYGRARRCRIDLDRHRHSPLTGAPPARFNGWLHVQCIGLGSDKTTWCSETGESRPSPGRSSQVVESRKLFSRV